MQHITRNSSAQLFLSTVIVLSIVQSPNWNVWIKGHENDIKNYMLQKRPKIWLWLGYLHNFLEYVFRYFKNYKSKNSTFATEKPSTWSQE